MNNTVSLSQQLYLLAIHPKKGGVVASSNTAINTILIGSLLLELYQQKNIRFENKRVFIDKTKTDNKLHEFVLEKMGNSEKPRKISTWINRLSRSAGYIKKEVQKQLVHERIITMQSRKFLFIKWKKPFLRNKELVYKLVDEVKTIISKGTSDENNLILLSLIKPAGLLYRLYTDRKQRKQAKERLNRMMAKNQVSVAVADAIMAAQAVAASVAATNAATAATG